MTYSLWSSTKSSTPGFEWFGAQTNLNDCGNFKLRSSNSSLSLSIPTYTSSTFKPLYRLVTVNLIFIDEQRNSTTNLRIDNISKTYQSNFRIDNNQHICGETSLFDRAQNYSILVGQVDELNTLNLSISSGQDFWVANADVFVIRGRENARDDDLASCQSGFFKESYQKVASPNDFSCVECHPFCLTCNGSTNKDCLLPRNGSIIKYPATGFWQPRESKNFFIFQIITISN